MAYDNDRGVGGFSRIDVSTLPAGIYYLKIQEYGNNGRIADYRLKVGWAEP